MNALTTTLQSHYHSNHFILLVKKHQICCSHLLNNTSLPLTKNLCISVGITAEEVERGSKAIRDFFKVFSQVFDLFKLLHGGKDQYNHTLPSSTQPCWLHISSQKKNQTAMVPLLAHAAIRKGNNTKTIKRTVRFAVRS